MDTLTRGTALNEEVRVYCCRTTELVQEARKRHDLWPNAAAALGRTLSVGAMMGTMLKARQEKIEIQINGKGPMGSMVVDAYYDGSVRGYVQNPHVYKEKDSHKLDVGACVGNRGARVQNIADELFGEKIDIIVWDEDPAVLISNVLRPAIVEGVYINEEEKSATAVVPEQQLSLAIGREGQNVRLAARVSGWKIDIKSNDQLKEMGFAFDEYEDSDVEEAGEVTEIEETQNN